MKLFTTHGPVPPDRLIGRSAEVSSLVDALAHGEHQVLTGPRRSGKPSIAHAAVAALERDGWRSLTVNLFHTGGLSELIDRLTPVGADAVRPISVGEALAVIEGLAVAADRRLVLVIDEFQELATSQLFGPPQVLAHELRTFLDASDHVVALFVSSAPGLMRDLFTTNGRVFYRLATIVELRPMDESTWREALRTRFAERGCRLNGPALDRLLELSGGHVRTAALLAQWTYALASWRAETRIGRPLVEEGFRSALSAEAALHDAELARVRSAGKHALGVALRLARGQSPYQSLAAAVARPTLRRLETEGLVEHPRSGTWRLADALFGEYLIQTVDPTTGTRTAAHAPASTPTPAPARRAVRTRSSGRVKLRRRRQTRDVPAKTGNGSNGHSGSNGRTGATGLQLAAFRLPTVVDEVAAEWEPPPQEHRARPRLDAPAVTQLSLLVFAVVLTLAGFAALMAREGWSWNGLGGVLAIGFVGCFIEAVRLSRDIIRRGVRPEPR